ncbi:glycosyltransferase family 2 protein [Novosphingobium sp. KCTC 2891]|uniref:glycosyltransferase family 2 protein n=1 Tax=Novosphingobium sp. KCTC 2891 TaxID=2989730 RepID=UPI002223CA64|nr:glycosyltransferase family A protein [Novosphingobium sp. KCTC 2891]MCW1383273.1 glycosyltransferase family 2 protein [Novosphingobium sp. KCTC 2891]
MSHPRVSVICTYLDAERFIAESLDSVFAQDFGDFELILVDDGSRDGSAAIARAYAERQPDRVHLLAHPGGVNRGISASRNLGLRHARGEYIAFIDADDVWPPAKLGEQVALLDAHPQAAMACGVVTYWASWDGGVDELVRTGGTVPTVLPPGAPVALLYPVADGAAPSPSEVLLRRSAVEAVGGMEDAFRDMYEDQVLFTKLMLQFDTCFSHRDWLHYRIHDDSCTAVARRKRQYLHRRRQYFEWLQDHLRRHPAQGTPHVARAVRRELRLLDWPLLWKLNWRCQRLRKALKRRLPSAGSS